jgi:hypothetical protein
MLYSGFCHCGAIHFEIEAPKCITVENCNCSICSMSGYLHLILPKSKFRLIKGNEHLSTYTWNTGVAKHTFCKTCGIKPFYTPRSNPEGIDINVRCLKPQPDKITTNQFDGQHWEANAHTLSHLDKEKE